MTDYLENVTLLFADIAGFTAYSDKVQTKSILALLSSLMTSFDKQSLKRNVYKVYTIGGILISNRLLCCNGNG